MGRKEIVLGAKELSVIGYTCKCGTKVLFDCSKTNAVPPSRCPSCDEGRDPMNQMMWKFKRFYESQDEINGKVEFHIQVPEG